jgi:hypothetical protein
MNGVSPVKHGFIDLAAVLFVVGGVVSLVMSILTIPIASIYPFMLPATFSTEFLVILAISLICSFGAIYCYSLATKRLLSEAGMRGLIFGALLLIFNLGLVGSLRATSTSTFLTAVSSVLILLAGAVCFALRHTAASASAAIQEHHIAQRA